jgi:menaquinone-dependent protoporphyrinogen oxidase
MVDYLSHHGPALGGRALGLFQVSLTSASADADHAERARALLAGLVDRFGLRPDVVATFAGALRYSRYGWLKRRLMRSIARREGGDTDTSHDHVYTDWDAVDRFAVDVRRVTDEVAGRVPAGRLCPIGPG